MKHIAIIGAGYVGTSIGVLISSKFDVKLFDIDGPNNLAPSLHILYTYLTVITLTQKTNSKKWHIWGALICLSVVFTHQHHIIDILSALILTYPLSKIKASQLFQRGLSFFYKM